MADLGAGLLSHHDQAMHGPRERGRARAPRELDVRARPPQRVQPRPPSKIDRRRHSTRSSSVGSSKLQSAAARASAAGGSRRGSPGSAARSGCTSVRGILLDAQRAEPNGGELDVETHVEAGAESAATASPLAAVSSNRRRCRPERAPRTVDDLDQSSSSTGRPPSRARTARCGAPPPLRCASGSRLVAGDHRRAPMRSASRTAVASRTCSPSCGRQGRLSARKSTSAPTGRSRCVGVEAERPRDRLGEHVQGLARRRGPPRAHRQGTRGTVRSNRRASRALPTPAGPVALRSDVEEGLPWAPWAPGVTSSWARGRGSALARVVRASPSPGGRLSSARVPPDTRPSAIPVSANSTSTISATHRRERAQELLLLGLGDVELVERRDVILDQRVDSPPVTPIPSCVSSPAHPQGPLDP